MIVGEDHSSGAISDYVREYIARMNQTPIEQADCDNPLFHNFVGAVECDADKVLLWFCANVGK